MIEKAVKKRSLKDASSIQEDLAYWLSKKPAERIEAVEILRRQYFGNTARLQRVARVIRRPSHFEETDLKDQSIGNIFKPRIISCLSFYIHIPTQQFTPGLS